MTIHRDEIQTTNAYYYPLLDSMRGFAILWIVCLHILADVRNCYGDVIYIILRHGYLGVEIFFVISGYGIFLSMNKRYVENKSKTGFLKRRFQKIYAPYVFSLIFSLFVIPIITAPISMIKSGVLSFEFYKIPLHEFIQYLTFLKVFTAKNWELEKAFHPINGALWYVAVLVQIYIVMFMLSFIKDYKKFNISLFLITFVAIITLFSPLNESVPYGLFLPYWPKFFLGGLLYLVIKNNFVLNRERIGKGFYISMLVGYLLCSSMLFFYFYTRNLACLLFVGLLWLLYPIQQNATFKNVFIGLLCKVGKFSYSLFLMHVVFWPFAGMFVRNLIPLPYKLSAPLVLVPIIILLSYFWYLFFEQPGSFRGSFKAAFSPLETLGLMEKSSLKRFS